MDFLPASTAADESEAAITVAVLPVGSFEQHGAHLPLATDSIIAQAISSRLAQDYGLLNLPPVTVGCSHEHEGLHLGTVSISARTLYSVVTDIYHSLARSGIDKLIIVSGHGGNYVLSNVAQELNVAGRNALLFPDSASIEAARRQSGCTTPSHEDMHAGEWETSILLAAAPHVVRAGWESADYHAPDRPDLLTVGLRAYTETGVVGRPSLASPEKGAAILDALSLALRPRLDVLLGK